jgi:hypothetical protein
MDMKPYTTGPVAVPATPAQAADGGETVTMVFPRDVLLTEDNHRRILFKAGVQEVPSRLKDHIYLQRHNVKMYNAPKKPPVNETHLEFMRADGFKFADLGEFVTFFNHLPEQHQQALLAEVAKANEPEQKPDPLESKTKAELVEHAKVVHNMDLDSGQKKEELLSAIRMAQAPKV